MYKVETPKNGQVGTLTLPPFRGCPLLGGFIYLNCRSLPLLCDQGITTHVVIQYIATVQCCNDQI